MLLFLSSCLCVSWRFWGSVIPCCQCCCCFSQLTAHSSKKRRNQRVGSVLSSTVYLMLAGRKEWCSVGVVVCFVRSARGEWLARVLSAQKQTINLQINLHFIQNKIPFRLDGPCSYDIEVSRIQGEDVHAAHEGEGNRRTGSYGEKQSRKCIVASKSLAENGWDPIGKFSKWNEMEFPLYPKEYMSPMIRSFVHSHTHTGTIPIKSV